MSDETTAYTHPTAGVLRLVPLTKLEALADAISKAFGDLRQQNYGVCRDTLGTALDLVVEVKYQNWQPAQPSCNCYGCSTGRPETCSGRIEP